MKTDTTTKRAPARYAPNQLNPLAWDNPRDTSLRCAAALQALQAVDFTGGTTDDLQYGLALLEECIEAALRLSAAHPDLSMHCLELVPDPDAERTRAVLRGIRAAQASEDDGDTSLTVGRLRTLLGQFPDNADVYVPQRSMYPSDITAATVASRQPGDPHDRTPPALILKGEDEPLASDDEVLWAAPNRDEAVGRSARIPDRTREWMELAAKVCELLHSDRGNYGIVQWLSPDDDEPPVERVTAALAQQPEAVRSLYATVDEAHHLLDEFERECARERQA